MMTESSPELLRGSGEGMEGCSALRKPPQRWECSDLSCGGFLEHLSAGGTVHFKWIHLLCVNCISTETLPKRRRKRKRKRKGEKDWPEGQGCSWPWSCGLGPQFPHM